jgi:hypothetical protein
MIDYAEHQIKIKQIIQESNKELLKNNFHEAHEIAMSLIVEAKLYANSIKYMIRDDSDG